mgnify:CR=1 FL=1
MCVLVCFNQNSWFSLEKNTLKLWNAQTQKWNKNILEKKYLSSSSFWNLSSSFHSHSWWLHTTKNLTYDECIVFFIGFLKRKKFINVLIKNGFKTKTTTEWKKNCPYFILIKLLKSLFFLSGFSFYNFFCSCVLWIEKLLSSSSSFCVTGIHNWIAFQTWITIIIKMIDYWILFDEKKNKLWSEYSELNHHIIKWFCEFFIPIFFIHFPFYSIKLTLFYI